MAEVRDKCSPSLTDEVRPNRLENFIFKLVIPFIRIANCKMGRYLKVQGNLIMISSDIDHSLSRILPQKQQIIPVCLKRKLSYKGYYIEEYVDKVKVQIYMNWFKQNNPLYKDTDFDANRIDIFEEEISEGVDEYNRQPEMDLDDEILKVDMSNDSDNDFDDKFDNGVLKPIDIEDEINIQHYDSVMCNKYEQEVDNNSVLKRYADIIIQYETSKNIPVGYEDDFDKEDFHNPSNSNEGFVEQANAFSFVYNDKFAKLSTDEVRDKAKQRITNVNSKLAKISIAPGEFGKFTNWGQDIFIEEKCFPHLFPFGVGGYMSSVLDGKDTEMGFSNYVRHRLLHVDSRYRNCTTYVFFLLLVKECIELQRCKNTYLRQARLIPSILPSNLP